MAAHGDLLALFKAYCTPEWQALARSQTTTLAFKAGETIFKEGQRCENMYMIDKGRVKVFTNFSKDVEVILRLANDGFALGHRGIRKARTFPVSAVAIAPTTINILPIQVFEDMLRANALFCYHFTLFLAEEMARSEQLRKNFVSMPVKSRVALALRINADVFGFDPNDPTLLAHTITRKEIAALANSTYESVVRTLGDLQEEGVITLERKKVRINDMDQLCRLTDCTV
ncbi:MAG: Crp/Fnr family transcriptional regulator [Flavobacteriales bacterium]|nr:Crp/Fnr family transcriptional regulator [Flavobacteriales bacterium]MBP9078657.1 Crp/Fnr family transcriptional regulator [Flavobacteriales bacterium]